jgi:hypothetical protein
MLEHGLLADEGLGRSPNGRSEGPSLNCQSAFSSSERDCRTQ